MIVGDAGDGRLRLITQPDHAHLAGEILSLWRADFLPEHPRREELLFAVREHDNGWREADSAPRVDPATGRPMDFLSVPDSLRQEIWRRGVERYRESRPYPAALIAEHALSLFGRAEGEGWPELLEKFKKNQDESLERSIRSREVLESDYAWLRLADDLSLWICTGRPDLERPGRRGRRVGDAWELHPFPFAGATTFQIPCRHLRKGVYPGDASLAVAAATARWEEVPVRLRPPSTGTLAW